MASSWAETIHKKSSCSWNHDKEVSKESLQSILDQILQKHIFLNWKNNASACKQWIQNVKATAANH